MSGTPKLTQADIDELKSELAAYKDEVQTPFPVYLSRVLLDAAERGLSALEWSWDKQDAIDYRILRQKIHAVEAERDQLKSMVRELASIVQTYIDESECGGGTYEQCPDCLHVLAAKTSVKKARKLVGDE